MNLQSGSPRTKQDAPILELRGVEKVFGGLRAIRAVSLSVPTGSIFGLIGPNGAGKTTLFNVITGVYTPDAGSVRFDGDDISGWKPAQIASRGIARTFQNIRLFRSMSVEQNVMVAGHRIHQSGFWDAIFRTRAYAGDERRLTERAQELLGVLDLCPLAQDAAGSLPYGSQRRLEIARALMLSPKLLLLDEPAAGMNSQEAQKLKDQILYLRDHLQISIMLVEHNMSLVMNVCDRIHVVDHGETIAEGSPEEIKKHPKVLAAYLGQEAEALA